MGHQARIHTFAETLDFLRRQRPLLQKSTSARQFDQLLSETELHLLGETVNWYSRRSFLGVR